MVFAGGGGLNELAAGLGVSTAFLVLETLLVLLLVFEAEGTGAGGVACTVPAQQHQTVWHCEIESSKGDGHCSRLRRHRMPVRVPLSHK